MSQEAKTLADREAEVRKFYGRMQENGMKPAAPAPHNCGHCHECERELTGDANSMTGPVCMSFYCHRFALSDDGKTNPYFGPCPIEAGQ